MIDIIRENLEGIKNWGLASFAACVIVFVANQFGTHFTWPENSIMGLVVYFNFRLSQKIAKLQNIGETQS